MSCSKCPGLLMASAFQKHCCSWLFCLVGDGQFYKAMNSGKLFEQCAEIGHMERCPGEKLHLPEVCGLVKCQG